MSDEEVKPARSDDDDWNRDFDPRSDARERALNVLFEADLRSCSTADVTARIQVPLDELTTTLIEGVSANRERIDQLISAHSHSWTIDRMATTDRNVMRIATFELLGRPEIPTAVVLNEAVGLAKRYGTDDSGKFVNGMLSAIARTVRGGAAGGQTSASGGASDESGGHTGTASTD